MLCQRGSLLWAMKRIRRAPIHLHHPLSHLWRFWILFIKRVTASILFQLNDCAGPEAVLRQPLKDMKVFECLEVLEFNQVSGAPEYS